MLDSPQGAQVSIFLYTFGNQYCYNSRRDPIKNIPVDRKEKKKPGIWYDSSPQPLCHAPYCFATTKACKFDHKNCVTGIALEFSAKK